MMSIEGSCLSIITLSYTYYTNSSTNVIGCESKLRKLFELIQIALVILINIHKVYIITIILIAAGKH